MFPPPTPPDFTRGIDDPNVICRDDEGGSTEQLNMTPFRLRGVFFAAIFWATNRRQVSACGDAATFPGFQKCGKGRMKRRGVRYAPLSHVGTPTVQIVAGLLHYLFCDGGVRELGKARAGPRTLCRRGRPAQPSSPQYSSGRRNVVASRRPRSSLASVIHHTFVPSANL